MFKRIIKGDFGYLQKKRKRVIILTIIYFLISISIFAIGYITTGTKRNLLTVVAVLGCLPACKSMVSMIMFIRAKGCPKEKADIILLHCDKLISMFDMYFTSYSSNFNILHMVVLDSVIIGFYDDVKFDEQKAVEHLKTMLKNDGYNVNAVTLTSDMDKYLGMLDNFNSKESSSAGDKDDAIRITLYQISL